MYKKKKDRKNIFLILGLIIILLIVFFIYLMNTKRNLNPVEKVIKDGLLFGAQIIYKPISFISDKIKESKDKNNLYQKYQELLEKYDNIKDYEITIDTLKKDNEELKKTLLLQNNLLDYEKVNATIVNRELNYWNDTFTIDKGEKDGIEINMAVVTADGLIGKIVETSNLYSKVRLLTSDSLGQKVSVRINVGDNKYVYGLLYGYNQKEKKFLIEGISENVDVPTGAYVTTTGMSDIFPGGILIGYVDSIKKDNFDLTMIAYVNPSVTYDDFSYVTILKRKMVLDD